MFIIPRRSLKSGGVIAPTPNITGVSPSSGSIAGGDSIIITGTSLGSASSVTIGGSPASITANTSTSITVTTPAHSAGASDVVVTTAAGSGTDTGAFTFTSGSYVGPADVTGFGSNVIEYWGMRAMDATYAASTGPLADWVRDDAATYTLHCLSTGLPDNAGLASWITGHTAKIVKVYGQKGGVHLLKDTFNTFPFSPPDGIASSGHSGSYPAIQYNGSSDPRVLQGSGLAAHTLPVTLSVALKMIGAANGYLVDIWDAAASTREVCLQLFQDFSVVRVFGGSDNYSFFSSIGTDFFSLSTTFQSTPTMDNNGDQQTAGGTFTPLNIGAGSLVVLGGEKPLQVGFEQPINGKIIEIMLTAGAVSLTNQELLRANQQAAGIVL
jgi:hypothetical protein